MGSPLSRLRVPTPDLALAFATGALAHVAARFRHGRGLRLAVFAIAAAICPPPARATHPDPLPDSVNRAGWVLRFTDTSPYDCSVDTPPPFPVPSPFDRNYLPPTQASLLLRALAGPWDSTVPFDPDHMPDGLGAFGFQLPVASDLDISSYDCAPNGTHADDDCDNGSANRVAETIRMPSTNYCNATPETILTVMGHEYFHHVQYTYLGPTPAVLWGKAIVEGSARMMEDQVFRELADGQGSRQFINQANQYLQIQSSLPLWWQAYDAALAWKYASERFGTLTDEPGYGVDFVRRFFENLALATSSTPPGDHPLLSGPHLFEYTMRESQPTLTLERWFHDFTLANLGRDFDTTSLPDGANYRYVDENDGTGSNFGQVSLDGFHLLSAGTPLGSSGVQMAPWTARYMKALVVDCGIGDIAGFRGNVTGTGLGVTNGAQLRFGVFAVEGALATRLVRGGGEEFGAAFALRSDSGGADPDLDVLGVTVTTTSGKRSLDYVFECGPGTLEIGFPTAEYQAYVGVPDDLAPGPLKIAIRVTGPPSLTTTNVKGLQTSDFSVYVGANGAVADRATIVGDLEEAGSSYFITAIPPTGKPNEGPYDLWVNFGPSLVATEADAVLYRERDVDEIVTIDISGSMAFPGTAGGLMKIESARIAAKALIDRARVPGQIGGVVFEENAQALVPAMSQASDNHKVALKSAVDNVNVSLLAGTSIGDGLDRARVEIVTHDGPGANWALLVSDGQETAPQFWATVAPAVKAAKVHVAAFPVGEDADHRLLEEISRFTEGFFWPLDAAPSASSATSAAPQAMTSSSVSDPLPNALADAFLLADEHARGASGCGRRRGAWPRRHRRPTPSPSSSKGSRRRASASTGTTRPISSM